MTNPRKTPQLILPTLVVLFCTGCSPPALFEHEYGAVLCAIESDAAIPTGMRRTTNGWEDASRWRVSTNYENRSIESWIEHQRRREPWWLRRLFEQIRQTPPLMVAVIQVTAIAAIIHIGRSRERGPPT